MGETDISAPRFGSELMSVTVRLPGALRDAAGGETRLSASGETLRDLIADIDRRYPGLASRVLDEAGALRSYVNVYIGEDDARTRGGSGAAVPDVSEVMVIPAMAGGGGGSSARGSSCRASSRMRSWPRRARQRHAS